MSGKILAKVSNLWPPNRIANAREAYQTIEADLKNAYAALERQRAVTNSVLERVIQRKVQAVTCLEKMSRISKNIRAKQRSFSGGTVKGVALSAPLQSVEKTLSSAGIVMDVAKGTTAGISTALGAWALVGSFGTASTGTAIAGLSGAAATNATLAWLGGGAVAAGGGGMAVGAAVLGGIVAIPALLLVGVFSHVRATKQIAEIEEAGIKATQAIADYKRATLSLNALERRGSELGSSIGKSTDIFQRQFDQTLGELYPWGIFSRLRRNVWTWFRKPFFDERDLRILAPLLQMASALADLVDTKLMDESGALL